MSPSSSSFAMILRLSQTRAALRPDALPASSLFWKICLACKWGFCLNIKIKNDIHPIYLTSPCPSIGFPRFLKEHIERHWPLFNLNNFRTWPYHQHLNIVSCEESSSHCRLYRWTTLNSLVPLSQMVTMVIFSGVRAFQRHVLLTFNDHHNTFWKEK